MSLLLVIFALFLTSVTEQVDKIFAEWDKPDSPGCAVAVIKDGKIVYKRGYGMADLERNVPISPTTVFDVGSVSKQFTAACILKLAGQGKLSLDDDIRKYLPELPQYEKPVTIRQLVHHTSGLRDYLTLMSMAGMRLENRYAEEEIYELIARQKALNFSPGDEHLYSNTGYFLLAMIVKRVSGQSLRQFADEQIFRPLGMKHSHFQDDFSIIVKNRAIGYGPGPQGSLRTAMSIMDVVGDGALMTTVEDLYLWDQHFYEQRLSGGKELVEGMLNTGKLNNGEKLSYAFGLVVDDYKGLKMVSHGGAWAGYRAEMIRFPEQRFSVICLTNSAVMDATVLCKRVADIYLADQFKIGTAEKSSAASAPAVTATTLPEAELRALEGDFRETASGRIAKLVMQDGKLAFRSGNINFPIAPYSDGLFRSVDTPFEGKIGFEKDDGGKVKLMTIKIGGSQTFRYEPAQLVELKSEELAQYAGDFYSEELGVSYRIMAGGANLLCKLKASPRPLPLTATVRDEFAGGGVVVRFTRDAQGQVSGFTINAGRVKNILFTADRRGETKR